MKTDLTAMRMTNPRTSTPQMMPTMSIMSELMPIPGSGFSVTMLGTTGGLSCLGPSFRPELGTEPSMLLLLAAISVPVGKTMNSSVPNAG